MARRARSKPSIERDVIKFADGAPELGGRQKPVRDDASSVVLLQVGDGLDPISPHQPKATLRSNTSRNLACAQEPRSLLDSLQLLERLRAGVDVQDVPDQPG